MMPNLKKNTDSYLTLKIEYQNLSPFQVKDFKKVICEKCKGCPKIIPKLQSYPSLRFFYYLFLFHNEQVLYTTVSQKKSEFI